MTLRGSRARTQKIQTEEIVPDELSLLLLGLLGQLLLELPGTDDRLLLLDLLGPVCVLLDKITDFRLGVVIVPRIDKDQPGFFLLEGDGVGDADEIQNHLQYLSIVLDVVLGLGKLAQLIDMRFEITQKFLIFLHQKLDSIERLRLDLKIVVDL